MKRPVFAHGNHGSTGATAELTCMISLTFGLLLGDHLMTWAHRPHGVCTRGKRKLLLGDHLAISGRLKLFPFSTPEALLQTVKDSGGHALRVEHRFRAPSFRAPVRAKEVAPST